MHALLLELYTVKVYLHVPIYLIISLHSFSYCRLFIQNYFSWFKVQASEFPLVSTCWLQTLLVVLGFVFVFSENVLTLPLLLKDLGENNIQSRHFFSLFFKFLFIYLFIYIYFWLCWVFVSMQGLSLVAASGGHSSSRCAGFSLSRPLLLRSTGSRRAGSVVVAHGPSCSVACGIFPDQGSNLCPLHQQADSQPLCHQGSPFLFNY